MDKNFKIAIPEPCHENWDKMTPNKNGRFCLSCSKTVTDFTNMLPEEIQHYFEEHQNEKICGRFKKSQLEMITIQIPDRVLYSQTNYYKIFLLALFIAMGTTLFSCSDKNGNKKKIDKVEIIKDTATAVKSLNAKFSSKSKDPNQVVTQKTNPIKFVKPVPTDCRETVANDSEKEDEIIYMGGSIEIKAAYPNETKGFYNFFFEEFKRPDIANNLNDRIIISFIIEKDGSLSSFQFPKNIDPQLESEITRVLNLCPKWIPGEQNGKKTREKYSFPISFEK